MDIGGQCVKMIAMYLNTVGVRAVSSSLAIKSSACRAVVATGGQRATNPALYPRIVEVRRVISISEELSIA
ncbi:hypothetical protein PF003_g33269 [Phytophthora fragariae]|nr:hypothetical protein PF003_g33269 [Phytophthora fragariae]